MRGGSRITTSFLGREVAVVQWIGNTATRLSWFAENTPQSAFSKKAIRTKDGIDSLSSGSFILRANLYFPKSVPLNDCRIGFAKGFQGHIRWETLMPLFTFLGAMWFTSTYYRTGKPEVKTHVASFHLLFLKLIWLWPFFKKYHLIFHRTTWVKKQRKQISKSVYCILTLGAQPFVGGFCISGVRVFPGWEDEGGTDSSVSFLVPGTVLATLLAWLHLNSTAPGILTL